eukprot:15463119-Alexandrium_andersonii.AAC.1
MVTASCPASAKALQIRPNALLDTSPGAWTSILATVDARAPTFRGRTRFRRAEAHAAFVQK